MAGAWVASTGTLGVNAGKMAKVHRHPKSWEPVREEGGARRYALKYALKTKQKSVPSEFQDVGRFWGCSRDVGRSAKEIEWECDASEYEVAEACRKYGREDVTSWEFFPADVWLPDRVEG